MGKVRFATIGRSGIAERFVDALSRSDCAELVAAYSRDASSAAQFAHDHGARLSFSSLDELAACDEVDAVYVASPDFLHAEQALGLVSAGKHVLVEKSFAACLRDARAVFDAARGRGVVAMEAMRNIHGPAFATVMRDMGRIGAPRLSTFRFAKVTSRIGRLRAGERVPVFDPRNARGALMDIGVYCVEPAVALFGRPRRVLAAGVTAQVPGGAPDDPYDTIDLAGEAILDYGEHLATVSWGKLSDGHLASEVQGELGTIVFGPTANPREVTLHLHEDKGMVFDVKSDDGERTEFDTAGNDMVFELEDFCAAVRGDRDALAKVERFERVTLDAAWVMEEIRRQTGVRFPTDDA